MAGASAAGDKTVALTGDARRAGESRLDRTAPKNPFNSTEAKAAAAAATGASATSSGSPSDPSSGFATGSGSSGGGSSTGAGSTGSGSTGGGSTGSGSTGSPSDPSSGFGQDQPTTKADTPRRLVAYKYTLDVEWGFRGQKLTRGKSVDQLQALPKGDHPLVVFLGVTSDGSRAAFGLAPHLEQSGEGSCRPSRTLCSMLFLRTSAAHNGHDFRLPDGRVFVIRIRGINHERVRKAAASSARALPALAAGVVG